MEINRQTYEEFFLLYTDGELSDADKTAVEDFLLDNPDLQEEFALLQYAVFKADENISFENKEELYREERRIVPVMWWRMSAAAILFLAFGISGWLLLSTKPKKAAHVVQHQVYTAPQIFTKEVPEEKPVEEEEVVVAKPAAKTQKKIPFKAPAPVYVAIADEPVPAPAINVRPHQLSYEVNEVPAPVVIAAKHTFAEPEENDMIYFANTTVSKRNKFRVVFRKATRLLDKVTSSQ